jgi:hypothetical protein
MALKIWLIRKIDEIELELKYLKALEIMLEHVEKATDYSDSDDDSTSDSKSKERDSEDSIRTSDIEALTDSDDDEEQLKKEEILSKIRELKNRKFKNI